MVRWVVILFAMLGALSVGVAGWRYGPWLQSLLTAQGDFLQSLEALVALLVVIGTITLGLWRHYRPKRSNEAENFGTVGGSVFGGTLQAGGDVAGRDIIKTFIYYGTWQGKPPRTDVGALTIYREVLAQRCGDIPLTGLDRDADDAGSRYRPLGLERVYVDLDTEMTVSEKALQTALATGQPLVLGQLEREQADDRRPLSALEAAALHRRLVLLGAPGSGKTTFVNRLCLALVRHNWQDLERWPARERNRLPILVVLQDFARWLKGHEKLPEPGAALLWDFIKHDLKHRNLGFAESLIETTLDKNAQVFLDGLDEVPPDGRQVVLETIKAFAERYSRASLLVISAGRERCVLAGSDSAGSGLQSPQHRRT